MSYLRDAGMSDDRVTRGINDFAAWAGVSRSTVERMIRDGQLRSKKIRGRRMIVVSSYMELVDGKRSYHRSRSPTSGPTNAGRMVTACDAS